MKVNRWQIDSKKLQVIPEDERVLFILLGHAVNEINILRKTFYLFSQFSEEPRWRVHVHTSQSLVFARILTGKLFEAWELLRKGYFGTRLSHEYDQHLDTEIKEALKSLKQYFGRDNLIDTIRNRFAFHYSPNDAKAILEHSLPNEEMVMYMAPDWANTLYYASEFVVNTALLETCEAGTPDQAIERLIAESTRVVRWFNDVAGGIMYRVVERYFLEADGKPPALEPINIGDLVIAENVEIPFFVTITPPNSTVRDSSA